MLDFYPGTDAEHPTAVEITFAPEGDGTRVRVLHRPTPASAALCRPARPTFARSWDIVLGGLLDDAGDLPDR